MRQVDGLSILVLPDVHDPVVFRTGRILAQAVSRLPNPASADGDEPPLALDMGTGSGIVAITCARGGYRVIGVDVTPAAVRCARANILINDVQDHVHVLQGDLFAPVEGKEFDLVTFNPPFFRGEPRDDGDAAWRSPDVIDRFAAGLATALRPEGRALVVFSSDGDESGLMTALDRNGFTTGSLVRRDMHNEVITVYDVTRL